MSAAIHDGAEAVSATTVYIERRVADMAAATAHLPLSVLDLGCGTGGLLARLLDGPYTLHGYDFPHRTEALRQRFSEHFAADYDRHIRITSDPQTIPFEADQFDVIVSNQVFEHVEHLDAILRECARVLKPNGALLTNFPLITTLVEPHVGVPFVHWMPPGSARRTYLRCAHALAGQRANADQAAEEDVYLAQHTHYRTLRTVTRGFEQHLGDWELETDQFVAAKLDLMENGGRASQSAARFLRYLPQRWVASAVTHTVNAAFQVRRTRSGAGHRPRDTPNQTDRERR